MSLYNKYAEIEDLNLLQDLSMDVKCFVNDVSHTLVANDVDIREPMVWRELQAQLQLMVESALIDRMFDAKMAMRRKELQDERL